MSTPPTHSIVVHGHFYQPPREDPWTGKVPAQPSAAPHHDWNERIARECYGPITSARILDDAGRVRRTLNALEYLSFDFGPTLLGWLERHEPSIYRMILQADRASAERLGGHGNAMAMAYHHTILPLATAQDRRTEIHWGIADFERRFRRRPEGMWLPETAVDSDTLTALAAEGIRFTILAPHQVVDPPPRGLPGRVVTEAGEIAVFVYDGGLSHGVAFGDLVRDGAAWARVMSPPWQEGRPEEAAAPPENAHHLRAICTDGETYGHHHPFAEMGLAAMLDHVEAEGQVRIENFASFLAAHPPQHEVHVVEPTAWSCAHGVERWRAECGCRADPAAGRSQAWRAPLREAMEWLAERLHEVFEGEGHALFCDSWSARYAYGSVASLGHPAQDSESVQGFLDAWTHAGIGEEGRRRAFELLEMERDALRLFTSCAWFFDDLARLEPLQILVYAGHAVERAGPARDGIEAGLLERLRRIRGEHRPDISAADLYVQRGLPEERED